MVIDAKKKKKIHLKLSPEYLNVGLLEVVRPSGKQVLPHLLVKVASIGDEGT